MPNPLRQAEQSVPQTDPYSSVYRQNPATGQANALAQPSLAASWPEIQTALSQGKLSQAHQLLSKWYDDPSLTPPERENVEALLSQLAGTVVYSTEHQLEPARVVKPGETLETIAQEYNVPWQLLAKINGIPSVDQVRPGQELKVVRGPFSAVVDLNRSQLTLMVDGRYAGKFPITVPTGSVVSEGEWVVQGKPEARASSSAYGLRQPSTASATGSRQLFLMSAEATSPTTGSPLLIGSSPALVPDWQRVAAGGQAVTGHAPYLAVSPSDAEELADILSIGSRVVVRR
jgi:LysM repeat protein